MGQDFVFDGDDFVLRRVRGSSDEEADALRAGAEAMTDDQQHALQDQRTREAMAVELAGLRADAERYRHIRKLARVNVADVTMDGVIYRIRYSDTFVRAKIEHLDGEAERFDAAIDAAMKEDK